MGIVKPRNAPFTARMGFDPSEVNVGAAIIQFPEIIVPRAPATLIAPGVWEISLVAPSVAGDYAVLWDADGALWRADDLTVTASLYSPGADPPPADPPTNDLLTVAEYKVAENLTDDRYDEAIAQIIPQVSAAIRSFTDRDFGALPVVEERTYQYRGGGVLDIDDCSTITAVRMDGRGLIRGRDYWPQGERSGGPYFYLDMYVEPGRLGSPEMGFTRNEDTIYAGPRYRPSTATVTVEGEFGWVDVPLDVKLAAIEMTRSVIDLPVDQIQGEALAEYSYTRAAQYNTGRWPSRAADLLRPYRRINL